MKFQKQVLRYRERLVGQRELVHARGRWSAGCRRSHGLVHLLHVGVRMVWEYKTVMNATRTTVTKALWRWARGIARACRRRHDGAVITGRKRGLSPFALLLIATGWIFSGFPLGVKTAQAAAPT